MLRCKRIAVLIACCFLLSACEHHTELNVEGLSDFSQELADQYDFVKFVTVKVTNQVSVSAECSVTTKEISQADMDEIIVKLQDYCMGENVVDAFKSVSRTTADKTPEFYQVSICLKNAHFYSFYFDVNSSTQEWINRNPK